MSPLPYKRPLIKLSGEALLGNSQFGIDQATVDIIIDDLCDVISSGCRASLVVGGGNIFRGVMGVAAGLDRVDADYMGMLATIMNGLALKDTLHKRGLEAKLYSGLPVPTICENFNRDRAMADIDSGVTLILAGGTGNPFFTTDTCAALRAAELGCDVIMKATQVDGVYDADPKQVAAAKRYDRISFSEILARDLRVMDGSAIALARDNEIPVVVFSLHEKGAIQKVMKGEAACTIVHTGDMREATHQPDR